MDPEERRRDEIDTRIAEMRYAIDHLAGAGDRRGRYLAQELDELLAECREAAERWTALADRIETLRTRLDEPAPPTDAP